MSLVLSAGVEARDAVLDLEVGDGETVAVLGPNGAGKSTLLGLAAGLVAPDRGAATLDGAVLFDTSTGVRIPPHRRRIALLDQRPALFPHLRVLGNVMFGARAAGRGERRARAAAWLAEVEAGELAGRRPTELSGGQAQRVALARALAAEPRVVLLDEPLAALDAAVAPPLRRMLRRVLADRSAVIVTHDVLDAWMLADRVMVVEGGRVVASGDTDEVLRNPRTTFSAELVGLGLVRGRRTGRGLRLPDGREIPAAPADAAAESDAPPGSAVRAAIDPAEVRVGGSGGIPARILALEPRGPVVRVRTDLVPADVHPSVAADLVEDSATTLSIPPSAVRLRAE